MNTFSGVFNEQRYWDVFVEYAKNSPKDILCRITVANRGPDSETIHVLPQLFYRNTWSWECEHEDCKEKPNMSLEKDNQDIRVSCVHETLGKKFEKVLA